ncbi:MAG: sulfite exporter TauE/SafE family protein [Bacteroidales bacterium]|nr:sulfite exporter TauE/SafE family protein [Bacteroidales bacterium]
MEWYYYIIIVAVGIVAGIINTLAAGGSLLTLPVLMALGLPPNMANGTNRIAIFLQNVVGVGSFHKQKVMDFPSGFRVGIPAVIGAIAGAFIAVNLNDEVMKLAIAGVMILVFFLMLLNPNRWINSHEEHPPIPYWMQVVVFFFVGIYGGFIQAGVGFFLLTSLVLGSGFELVKANALKLFVILLYTPLALVIFFVHGDVNIWMGLVLAVGNMTGAWIGTKIAVKQGAKFIRYFVLVAILIAATKLIWDAFKVL